MKGKLIVIEGSDSSGKHTQGTMLVEALNKSGKKGGFVIISNIR